jgi:hypothetical protein
MLKQLEEDAGRRAAARLCSWNNVKILIIMLPLTPSWTILDLPLLDVVTTLPLYAGRFRSSIASGKTENIRRKFD